MSKINVPDFDGFNRKEVEKFIEDNDTTMYFRQLWGDEYAEKAMDNWVSAKADITCLSLGETILAIAYNFAVAPYVDFSDESSGQVVFYKRAFYQIRVMQDKEAGL